MTPTEVLFTIAELQEQVHQASTELLTAAVAVRTENLVKQPAALTEDLAFVQVTLTRAIRQAEAAIVTAAELYTASTPAKPTLAPAPAVPVLVPLSNGSAH